MKLLLQLLQWLINFVSFRNGRGNPAFFISPTLRLKILNLNRHDMGWKPKVTVAAFIEQDCKILNIEERTLLFNQPVDHLLP